MKKTYPGAQNDMIFTPAFVLIWISAVALEVLIFDAAAGAFSLFIGGAVFWALDGLRNRRYDKEGVRR